MKSENVEQRSQDWHKLRMPRFTSSDIVKLFGTGKEPCKFGNTLNDWPDTAQNYILSKVAGTFAEREQPISSVEMRWGTEMEDEGKAYFEFVFDNEIENVGFVLWPKNVNAGCSPDGIIDKGKTLYELKCPFTLHSHVESFLIKDNATFKKMRPQYYWQVMSSMLFTGLDKALFMSYHPYFVPDKRISAVEILADQTAFKMLEERIIAAVETRDSVIQMINNQK